MIKPEGRSNKFLNLRDSDQLYRLIERSNALIGLLGFFKVEFDDSNLGDSTKGGAAVG